MRNLEFRTSFFGSIRIRLSIVERKRPIRRSLLIIDVIKVEMKIKKKR